MTGFGAVNDEGEAIVREWKQLLEVLAGISALLSCLISFVGILRHMLNYRQPERQRRVVRIMLMVPIYAVVSWLSLCFIEASLYLDTIRDVYEAYALYQFFMLCVSFLGGEPHTKLVFSRKADQEHLWPLNLCLPLIRVSDAHYYLTLKRGILQFVVLKPVGAFCAVLLQFMGLYCNGEWKLKCGYMYHNLIINTSVSIALYCLVLFHHACKEELTPWRPVCMFMQGEGKGFGRPFILYKFLSVKAVIFFSFWQGVVFSLLVATGIVQEVGYYTADYLSYGMQDFLICVEMLLFAFAHLFVFPPEDYQTTDSYPRSWQYAVNDIFTIGDVVHDTRETFNIMPPVYQRVDNDELPETHLVRTMRAGNDSTRNSEFYQLNTYKNQPQRFDSVIEHTEPNGSWDTRRSRSPGGNYGGLSIG